MAQNQETFKSYSISEYSSNKVKLEEWAKQSNNPLLQALAKEVIETAKGAGG